MAPVHSASTSTATALAATPSPVTIAPEKLAAEAAQVMQSYRIGGRLVVTSPDGVLQGIVTFNDLLAAGVV